MKIYSLFILILVTILFYQCKDEKKNIDSKITIKKDKKVLKKEIIKRWDSLNSTNVEAFFTEYAKKNKETKVIIKTKFGFVIIL